MIQLPVVSVSASVQRSSPIFQPNSEQCILINQFMLFLVNQCYYIVIYKHAQCQLVKYMNWPDSLDYKIFWKLELPGKIFLKHYFLINDFSDIVFFKKRFIPHIEVFFSVRAPSSSYFEICKDWPWMGVGCEYLLELHIQIKSTRTSVFILTKSDFQPGWPFDWDCAHCCTAIFQFLV